MPLKLEQANKAQRAIHEGKYASLEEHWPLLAKDGDMISFLDSVSAGSVSAERSLPVLDICSRYQANSGKCYYRHTAYTRAT